MAPVPRGRWLLLFMPGPPGRFGPYGPLGSERLGPSEPDGPLGPRPWYTRYPSDSALSIVPGTYFPGKHMHYLLTRRPASQERCPHKDSRMEIVISTVRYITLLPMRTVYLLLRRQTCKCCTPCCPLEVYPRVVTEVLRSWITNPVGG